MIMLCGSFKGIQTVFLLISLFKEKWRVSLGELMWRVSTNISLLAYIFLICNSIFDINRNISIVLTLLTGIQTLIFVIYTELFNKPQQYFTYTETINKECSICLERLEQNLVQLRECPHVFHKVCIDEWFKQRTNCPLCRVEV